MITVKMWNEIETIKNPSDVHLYPSCWMMTQVFRLIKYVNDNADYMVDQISMRLFLKWRILLSSVVYSVQPNHQIGEGRGYEAACKFWRKCFKICTGIIFHILTEYKLTLFYLLIWVWIMKLPIFAIFEEICPPIWCYKGILNSIRNSRPIRSNLSWIARWVLFHYFNCSITHALLTDNTSLNQLSWVFEAISPVSVFLEKIHHVVPWPYCAGIQMIWNTEEVGCYSLWVASVHTRSGWSPV